MNSIESQVIIKESSRLESLGIPYDHIHCSEGKAIVTVKRDVMNSIISMRDQGKIIKGSFIAFNGNEWVASVMDDSGKHRHRSGLTECRAYRWVLGYPVGRKDRHFRYSGQPNYRNSRRKKGKHAKKRP